ncbi:type II toxin-antitoxin system HicB family antitoxin [Planktothricoides raciborskii]|uniref:Type II toxin-antitoxin system HicB family antitoxin n=2 Tax=Planktothricoides raciborskii TaxID=132608 RepID=A0AAU8J9R0_9CYAN|nr:type II toxin-antitoxin system HicB family antitoxin [Planktothricoides raciborskii]
MLKSRFSSILTFLDLMEKILNLQIEKLPEGVYLATSDELPGLVAQGRTITETLEIARDVARKLLEAKAERNQTDLLKPIGDRFNYPLVVGQ